MNCNGRYLQILAIDYINHHPVHSSSSECVFVWLGVFFFFFLQLDQFYSLIGRLEKKNKDQFCSRAVKKGKSSLHMCGFRGAKSEKSHT